MTEVVGRLLEKLPDGLPACSRYDEFRRITGKPDTADVFIEWAKTAVLLMRKPEGAA